MIGHTSPMRPVIVALLLVLAFGARGQSSSRTMGSLDDALTLANLRYSDLGQVTPAAGALSTQTVALGDPISAMTGSSLAHHAALRDEASMLKAAMTFVDVPEREIASDGTAELPASVPASLRVPLARMISAVASANKEIRTALVRLTSTDRRILIEALPRLATGDSGLPLDFAKGVPNLAEARRSLDLVDVKRIESAGIALSATVRATLPSLRAVDGAVPNLLFRSRGVLVEIAGKTNDVHERRDAGLCIDFGGDDRYTGRYGSGVGYAGVLVDLDGNDRYNGPDANYGAGLLGVGLLYDLGGDDTYGIRSVGLGTGLAGFGLLSDASGDDRYRVVGFGLGAGYRGIGIAADRGGDDVYDAGRVGEGYGENAGLGWLIDVAGRDSYSGGQWVQATGKQAGFGLLTDGGGDDVYDAISGQAAAVGGYASLDDAQGNDHYNAAVSAQAFASDGGYALFHEGSGEDSYLLRRGPGQAAAFGGIAILMDDSGDDVYGGTDGTPASAFAGGVALMLDDDGDDRYLSSSPFRKDSDGIALWVDGRGRDRYGDGRRDAQATVVAEGAAYDAFGADDSDTLPNITPLPGSVPVPSREELARLRDRAVNGPDTAGAYTRLIAMGVPGLEAMSSDPDETFIRVAMRLGTIAAPTIARLGASDDVRSVRAALSTAGFVPLPPEAIVKALERPELAALAAEAAGRARLVLSVPSLVRITASGDPLVVRRAATALAEIGDPSAVGTASALIDNSDPTVRRAAFRLLSKSPEVAYSTGLRLIGASEEFRRRIGLRLLGAVGTPSALAAIGPSLRGSREMKIGALVALDGKVPTELITTVEALRRDPDPLVRAVAERTDVGL